MVAGRQASSGAPLAFEFPHNFAYLARRRVRSEKLDPGDASMHQYRIFSGLAAHSLNATWASSGAAATWPLAARAQQPAMPVIGVLDSSSPAGAERRVRGVREGLKKSGYF